MSLLDDFKRMLGLDDSRQEDAALSDSETGDLIGSIDDYYLPSFLNGEGAYRSQKEKLPLYEYGKPVLLDQLVDFFLGPEALGHLTGAAITASNLSSTDCGKTCFLSGETVKAGYDVLPLVLDKEQMMPKPGENAVLTLLLYNARPVVMHLRNMQTTPDICYLNVSCMVTGTNDFDDLRMKEGKNLPKLASTLVAYRTSHADLAPMMATYEKTLREMQTRIDTDENIEGNDILEAVYEGVNGVSDLRHYLTYGYWLMNHDRYYDALQCFETMHRYLSTPADNNAHGQPYSAINNLLAQSLTKTHYYEEAFHHISVAAHYASNLNGSVLVAMARLADYRVMSTLESLRTNMDAKDMQAYIEDYDEGVARLRDELGGEMPLLTLGFVLRYFLRVDKHNIPSLTLATFKDGECKHEYMGEGDLLWALPMEALMSDGNTIVLGYTHHRDKCKTKDDKSIHFDDNCIIMQVNAIDGTDLARVDVMRPRFVNDPGIKDPKVGRAPESTSFIIGLKPYEYDFSQSMEEIMDQAFDLCEEWRMAEAMVGFLYVYHSILLRFDDADEEEQPMCLVAAGKVGFCLMEQGLLEMADYYLEVSLGINGVNEIEEYINCLCNSRDVRALTVVDNCLLSHYNADAETKAKFRAFLKRRKVYLLIDWHMLDEAKELLQHLLDDPLCAAFARNELAHIEQLEKENPEG